MKEPLHVKIRYASFFAVSTADIIAIVKGVFKTMVFLHILS